MSDDTTSTQEIPRPPATPSTPVPAATGAQATTASMSQRAMPDRALELKKAASEAGRDGSRTSVMRYMQQKRCGAD